MCCMEQPSQAVSEPTAQGVKGGDPRTSASVLHETFLHGDRTIFMNIKISKKEIAVIEIVPQI